METHDALRKLKEVRYSIEPEDCEALSEGLTQATNFEQACLDVAEAAIEHELQAKAVADRIAELSERKARLLKTADNLRAIILQSMEIRSIPAIKSPHVTLSVTRRSGDLVVTDESLIPSRFFKPQPPVLDKKSLKEAVVTDGEVIDGAAIGNSSISLTIRRK